MTRFPTRLRRLLPLLLALAVVAGLASAQSTNQSTTQSTTAAGASGKDPVVIRLGDQTETLSDFEARFDIAIRSLAAQQGCR